MKEEAPEKKSKIIHRADPERNKSLEGHKPERV